MLLFLKKERGNGERVNCFPLGFSFVRRIKSTRSTVLRALFLCNNLHLHLRRGRGGDDVERVTSRVLAEHADLLINDSANASTLSRGKTIGDLDGLAAAVEEEVTHAGEAGRAGVAAKVVDVELIAKLAKIAADAKAVALAEAGARGGLVKGGVVIEDGETPRLAAVAAVRVVDVE